MFKHNLVFNYLFWGQISILLGQISILLGQILILLEQILIKIVAWLADCIFKVNCILYCNSLGPNFNSFQANYNSFVANKIFGANDNFGARLLNSNFFGANLFLGGQIHLTS